MTWLIANFDQMWSLTVQHIVLSVLPTIFGLVLAVPLGMLIHDTILTRKVVVILASMAFTIPSLALFVVIPAIIGTQVLNPANIVIALTLYSFALLVRTVLESLDAVPEDVRSASRAMGTSPMRQAIGVDLPLAISVLTAGTRVVAVTNVSLVTVGAVIGIGGLGELFTAGYQRNYPQEIIAGLIATLILAFAFDRLLFVIGSILTPWIRATKAAKRRKPDATRTLDTIEGPSNVR